jgi:hypothetical protein
MMGPAELVLGLFLLTLVIGVVGGIRMGMFTKAYDGVRVGYDDFYLPIPKDVAARPDVKQQVASAYGVIGKALNEKAVPNLNLAVRELKMEGVFGERRKLVLTRRGTARVYVHATPYGNDLFASMAVYFVGPIRWWKWLLIGFYIMAWIGRGMFTEMDQTVLDLMRDGCNEFQFDDVNALSDCVRDALTSALDEIGRGMNLAEQVLVRAVRSAARPVIAKGRYVRA